MCLFWVSGCDDDPSTPNDVQASDTSAGADSTGTEVVQTGATGGCFVNCVSPNPITGGMISTGVCEAPKASSDECAAAANTMCDSRMVGTSSTSEWVKDCACDDGCAPAFWDCAATTCYVSTSN